MTAPVRIPADVDISDRVIGPLTTRQATILGLTGLVLYAAWDATRTLLGTGVFLALAAPVAVTAVVLALGTRDGIPLDRTVLAAIRHRAAPRTLHAAPDGTGSSPVPEWLDARSHHLKSRGRRAVLRLPATGVGAATTSSRRDTTAGPRDSRDGELGVVDLGGDGLAVVAVASTVNFALRSPAEQEALVATFGRYLHSLSAPVQVLVRSERLDVGDQVGRLRADAARLPHSALQTAALEHADFLAGLAEQSLLLRRQVLLVLREPISVAGPVDGLGGPSAAATVRALLASAPRGGRSDGSAHPRAAGSGARRAAEARLVRRLAEAVELLAPAGIDVQPLNAARTTAVLAAACNPDPLLPFTHHRAGGDEVIGGTAGGESDGAREMQRRRDIEDSWEHEAWDDESGDDEDDGIDEELPRLVPSRRHRTAVRGGRR